MAETHTRGGINPTTITPHAQRKGEKQQHTMQRNSQQLNAQQSQDGGETTTQSKEIPNKRMLSNPRTILEISRCKPLEEQKKETTAHDAKETATTTMPRRYSCFTLEAPRRPIQQHKNQSA
jgi:hypothetical protein